MNRVILCGRLTAKPELRYTANNTGYARFSIAVNRPKQKDKEQQADFLNCIAWGKLGEIVEKYFDKGSQILVNGRIQNTSYQDKEGNKRVATDIVIDEIEFVGSKKQEETKEEIKEEPTTDPFAEFGNEVDNYLE